MGKLLGTFGKGIAGSISMNYSESGGSSCDTNCRLHPDTKRKDKVEGTPCYAMRMELIYSAFHNALKTRAKKPAWALCGQALLELQALEKRGVVIPWFRFSVAGSVPQPDQVRQDRLFRLQFRTLVKWLVERSIPVHLPVESYNKARFYRGLVGDLITVRESAQTETRFRRAQGAVSLFVGEHLPRRQRVSKARQVAKDRREATGRKTIVCPAVTHGWAVRYDDMTSNPRAKCGACTACADGLVDIVYPKH